MLLHAQVLQLPIRDYAVAVLGMLQIVCMCLTHITLLSDVWLHRSSVPMSRCNQCCREADASLSTVALVVASETLAIGIIHCVESLVHSNL
jgi:hypothetical protein